MPERLAIAFSELQPGPDGPRVRVRTGRVLLAALLVTLGLGSSLVACVSLPGEFMSSSPSNARFTAAVADAAIYSPFGEVRRRSGGRTGRHTGIDLAAPQGTPVHAAGPGMVTYAGWNYEGSQDWGLLVAIDHGEGWVTLYAHLSDIDVVAGDPVNAGAELGQIGTTGNATGPHVHFELRHAGERLDPRGHVPGLE
ncbi:M23 family metallopeptidase [Maricaulis sp.]|uniref:M23 family metallopeptidase n=1 Tax=Maricaulis sp. TaxID=1486257 RepID=UPI003A9588A4